jgi:hypothetical protein
MSSIVSWVSFIAQWKQNQTLYLVVISLPHQSNPGPLACISLPLSYIPNPAYLYLEKVIFFFYLIVAFDFIFPFLVVMGQSFHWQVFNSQGSVTSLSHWATHLHHRQDCFLNGLWECGWKMHKPRHHGPFRSPLVPVWWCGTCHFASASINFPHIM